MIIYDSVAEKRGFLDEHVLNTNSLCFLCTSISTEEFCRFTSLYSYLIAKRAQTNTGVASANVHWWFYLLSLPNCGGSLTKTI